MPGHVKGGEYGLSQLPMRMCVQVNAIHVTHLTVVFCVQDPDT